MNQQSNQQTESVGDDMAFPPFGLRVRILAMNPAALRRFNALTVDQAGGRTGPPPRMVTLDRSISLPSIPAGALTPYDRGLRGSKTHETVSLAISVETVKSPGRTVALSP